MLVMQFLFIQKKKINYGMLNLFYFLLYSLHINYVKIFRLVCLPKVVRVLKTKLRNIYLK